MGAIGIFRKDLSKSILYSLRLPELAAYLYARTGCRAVRKRGGAEDTRKPRWFQTVKSDVPHFTDLGVRESDAIMGLKPLP